MLRALSLVRNRIGFKPIIQTPLPCSPCSSSPFSSSKSLTKGNEEETSRSDAVSLFNRDPTSPPRLFLVQPRLVPPKFLQAKLNEALCLANSLEEQRDGYFESDFFDRELPPHVVVQNPILKSSKPRADMYFGSGTVENVKCHLNAADSEEEVDAVFVNTSLTAIQQRNLERVWEKPVLDRVGLIIEIFNAHAHSKEAKLQAELAALMYKKSRLVRVRGPDGRQTFGQFGEAEVVSARGRGSGGRGFISGAGETELQLQRRRILERRNHLLSQIKEVKRTRALQRAARKRQGGLDGQSLATIAVVGYTNAGKSTLISELTNTTLYSNERLFATLDPRLKSVTLPSGRKVLLSDTVGFISDLPVQLVKAFQSTLEEVVEADLLLHVVDSTAPNLEEHRSTVFQVLHQIGVPEDKLQNMIEVWNKIDYEEEEMDDNEYIQDDEETTEENTEALDQSDNLSLDETRNVDQDDHSSDGWLLSEDDNDNVWDSSLDQQSPLEMKIDVQNSEPNLKISAVTGVGLQELLELIDERLKARDEKVKIQTEVEKNNVFSRKWRPPREEEVAVEQ